MPKYTISDFHHFLFSRLLLFLDASHAQLSTYAILFRYILIAVDVILSSCLSQLEQWSHNIRNVCVRVHKSCGQKDFLNEKMINKIAQILKF